MACAAESQHNIIWRRPSSAPKVASAVFSNELQVQAVSSNSQPWGKAVPFKERRIEQATFKKSVYAAFQVTLVTPFAFETFRFPAPHWCVTVSKRSQVGATPQVQISLRL
ncbi:hypothetical protein F1559_005118 [Cyanidiococcus yangmingshanensis]|uniref:Uncharacterized protein n=1 Tax=Cyanidiococcus yangmingshanensis TaxID=2690220 RepID=A0A7J7ISH6_9RHOD|nr:hypothetical protein F1559_005118 [Cyanidiococcus yangmingshanensis]